ncbi:MAG TPA: transglutaminase-like domain-containing protein [Acidimicrobiia bacterium]
MDATERFTEVVQRAEADVPLDVACLLIAAHAHPSLDVDLRVDQLDTLAHDVGADDARMLSRRLFGDAGFTGNTVDYGDPRNSCLDEVLDRRLGIPITLSVLMMEVGRRRGIEVSGVGMPGHFLVGAPTDGGRTWFDPFNGGVELDVDGCAARFGELFGDTPFRVEYLSPVGPVAILDRMLTNLQHTLVARDPARAPWPTRLRLRLPGVTPVRRAELAGLLGSLGQFSEAARELDAVAQELSGTGAEEAAQAAARLRARAN